MSTRIYNGFEFRSPDFLAADRLVRAFRPVVEKLQTRLYADYVAARAIRILDSALLDAARGHEPEAGVDAGKEKDSPLMAARMEVMDLALRSEKSEERNPLLDTYFEIWMIAHENRLFGMVNAGQNKWVQRWMRQAEIRPMPYWNNSDRPEHISAREWSERGRIWNGALGASGIPASSCWTAQIDSKYVALSPDLSTSAARMAPGMSEKQYESRLRQAAIMLLMQEEKLTSDNAVEFMDIMRQSSRRIAEGADPEAVEAERMAAATLSRRVTPEMLRTSVAALKKGVEVVREPGGPSA